MKFLTKLKKKTPVIFFGILIFVSIGLLGFLVQTQYKIQSITESNNKLNQSLEKTQKDLTALKNIDQYKRNEELSAEEKNIKNSYAKSIDLYEKILDLKVQKVKTDDLEKEYAGIVNELSQFKYASASSDLALLDKDIQKNTPSLSSGANTNAPVSNTPPGSGYNLQQVQTDSGAFTVAIIVADLNSTKIIVDTASDGICTNDCPVLPLSTYVSRSGAYAGINGSFFCPAEYPSCAGKTNSFDLLVMNKNKVYFNSDNNVYSTNPAVIFGNGWIRFVSQALQWGRDTSVDGVLSNYPLYVLGGNNVFGGSGDSKLTSKGTRGFVANKGNTVYIGFVYSASSDDAAKVLKALGMENAMGLDQGGSTALWFNGYKAGPGRNIPNAILFIRK